MAGNVMVLAGLPNDEGEDLETLLDTAGSIVSELAPKGKKPSGPSYRSMAERYGNGSASVSCIAETFGQSGVQMSEFRKNQKKVERRLRYDSGGGAIGLCYRSYRKAAQKVTGAMPDSSLDSMIAMHVALIDNVRVDFKHVVNMCEDYVAKLMEYEAELFARLQDSCDIRETSRNVREDAHKLHDKILAGVENKQMSAKERLRSEHIMFRLQMKGMTQYRERLCSDMEVYYGLSNKETIQKLAEQMHNLGTYCDGICKNLDGIREHLGKTLPMYANGARIARAAVDMDSMLRMLGGFSEKIFANYTNGVSLVEQLHSRQPLDGMYDVFEQRLSGMNDKSLEHIKHSSRYFKERLAQKGF